MLYTMLFGVNPFELPLNAETQAKLAAVMGGRELRPNELRAFRILNALWRFPDATEMPAGASQPSEACCDLLRRLMVADPANRLSIADIQRHPWFLTNLPESASTMNASYLGEGSFDGMQSEEDIRHVMSVARNTPATTEALQLTPPGQQGRPGG